ncbi:prominin-2 isoform X2 [Taeniopygia guttata]|uniref:prominin-2 isoform X2 n=1 Tax=Taeniopygia guttata TaxID=59729 RepID=UPI003BB8800F
MSWKMIPHLKERDPTAAGTRALCWLRSPRPGLAPGVPRVQKRAQPLSQSSSRGPQGLSLCPRAAPGVPRVQKRAQPLPQSSSRGPQGFSLCPRAAPGVPRGSASAPEQLQGSPGVPRGSASVPEQLQGPQGSEEGSASAPVLLPQKVGDARLGPSACASMSFVAELLRTALNEPGSVRTAQVVQYELGYVVCAAVALLFAVAVPVAGMCFCYCRSRRRCGGRLRAHRRSLGCRRRCLLACLSLTSLVMLVSASCALVSSQRVKGQMEPGLGAVPSTLRTLQQHLDNVPQGVQMAVDKFEVPQKQILSDLGGLSRSVGLSIHAQLSAVTYAALADLQDRAAELQASLQHLQTVHSTARALAAAQAELEPALRERRRGAVALLDDPRCTSCASALGRAQRLQLGADFAKVPSVEKVLKALAGLPRSDFAEMIRQGNGTFNSIPELAVERMAQLILDLRADLARTAEKVQSIADSFPLPDYTRPASEALAEAERRSRPYLREARRFERYRWIAGTVLCSIILLILACNVTGMALGAYGLSKREDPSDYECRGEAGAKFLLVGVALAFLFSWLLILLVFATFLVGGNIQTLVCRNWVNQEIYKFIDTPGNLPPSMNLSRQLNLRRDSNLSSAYRECKGGAGLWEVLQLDSSYDLDEHLRTPKYTADLQKRLGGFTVSLGDVRLLRSEGRQDLETFARSGLDELDYGRFQEELQNPVVQTSLPGLARSLEGLQKMQRNGTVAGRLAAEARALWHMQNSTVRAQEALVVSPCWAGGSGATGTPLKGTSLRFLSLSHLPVPQAKLGESVQFLSRLAPHLKERVRRTLATTASLEARLPLQAQQILRQELGCFTRKELRYFTQYLNWVGQTLREDVASCQPLATALDNGRVILCDRIAEPWNAFWFSLGCCTFLLIPSIIFAIRLTKHFRPIRNRLISTGSEETCPFHIPRVTALKL